MKLFLLQIFILIAISGLTSAQEASSNDKDFEINKKKDLSQIDLDDASPTIDNKKTFENTLGMKFVPVRGLPVLFSVWETRRKDFLRYLKDIETVWDHTTHFSQDLSHPVVNITYNEAVAFCEWLTKKEQQIGKLNKLQKYRLPTLKEWDLASGRLKPWFGDAINLNNQDEPTYPWGKTWPPKDNYGNYADSYIPEYEDGFRFTAPVGSYSPDNPSGLYDISGNVWEWVTDYSNSTSDTAILKGASWIYFLPKTLDLEYEFKAKKNLRTPTIGFRIIFEDLEENKKFALEVAKLKSEKYESKKDLYTTEIPNEISEEVKKRIEKAMSERQKTSVLKRMGESSSTNKAPEYYKNLPVVKRLKPLNTVPKGTSFVNFLGMEFLPLDSDKNTYICLQETTIGQYTTYLYLAQKPGWQAPEGLPTEETHPISYIDWNEAREFCTWLTNRDRELKLIGPNDFYQLPTDKHWSLTAKQTADFSIPPRKRQLSDTKNFYWGDSWPPPALFANLRDSNIPGYQDSHILTAPVGSYMPDAKPYLDLAGNISEWCDDYPDPDSAEERVVRGPSWASYKKQEMLISYRQFLPATTKRATIGFRVALIRNP